MCIISRAIMRNISITKKNKRVFEKLVKANMKKAYFAAISIVGSHDAAMDLSQGAFIKAYSHFDKFDKDRNFFIWYYKILKNLCLNFIRDKKNNISLDCFEMSNQENSDDPKIKYEQVEQSDIIKKALLKLSVEERELLILKEFQNYSYTELSELFEIPIGTVMSKLFYARKKLAKNLDLKELVEK